MSEELPGLIDILYENQRNERFKIQPYHQSPTAPPSLPEHEGGQQHRLQELEGQVCLTSRPRSLSDPLRERARLLVSAMQKKKKARIPFFFFLFVVTPPSS